MALPLSALVPGRPVRLRLDGAELSGTVQAVANGWVRLAAAEGELLINLAQVAWIRPDGAAAPDDERLRPAAKEVVARPGSKVPGRPWSDGDIRTVVDEFLADRPDGEIAQVVGRTRHQVTVLRQAWECARGNLPDDQLSPAARLWVERVQSALSAR